MKQAANTRQCPFCLNDNDCQAQTEHQCWCFTSTIPKALLELLPQQSDKTCICSACIRAYQDNPQAFAAKYQQPPVPGC
ncbi:cysteine-rich CWC family protein [Thalassomonas haliotis]|uniref:Cysteine-rich CWC family protein n=1 Tax=Thalassomonas haliotis TaxID=485448 RepID=A0ABY7VHX7_9GAMM|nr:cysteine-rich CWC family protein [Thalassomonas haliotis]WDE12967.1 cysteine-rich CWC family protein [Thalassomonas haliotis]